MDRHKTTSRKSTRRLPVPPKGTTRDLERFVSAVREADFYEAMEALSELTPPQIKALRKDRGLLEQILEGFELLDSVAMLDVFGRGSIDPLTAYGGIRPAAASSYALEEEEDPEDPEERSEIIEDGELRATSRNQSGFADYLSEQRVPVMEQLELTGVLEGNTDWEVFFRIASHFSALDRQIALVEVHSLGMWDELLAQMDKNSGEVLRGWLDEETRSADTSVLRETIAQLTGADPALAALDATERIREEAGRDRARLSLRLQELIVDGTATASGTYQGLPRRGLLGAKQAERAARALIAMPHDIYQRFLLLLLMAPIPDRVPHSALLLKALAARLNEMSFAVDAADAIEDLEDFATNLRELHGADLTRATSVLQATESRPGLQQRFSYCCNVTAALIVRAEADPMEAFRLNQEGQLTVDALHGQVAAETAECLERHGNNRVICREPSTVMTRVHAALLSQQDEVPLNQLLAVRDYLAGRDPDISLLRAALGELRRTASEPSLFQDEFLSMLRETDAGTTQPGLDPWQLAEECNVSLGYDDILGRQVEVRWSEALWAEFNGDCQQERVVDREIPRPLPDAWQAQCQELLDFAAEKLHSRQDVLLQIYWEGAGGRSVSAHDLFVEDGQRMFLVHDPCVGVTSWWSESQLLDGTCPTFGRRGLLCAVIG